MTGIFCDICEKKRSTLYDLNNRMVCLDCVGEEYDDLLDYPRSYRKIEKLMKAAVTGEGNIRRRRNSIERRKPIK